MKKNKMIKNIFFVCMSIFFLCASYFLFTLTSTIQTIEKDILVTTAFTRQEIQTLRIETKEEISSLRNDTFSFLSSTTNILNKRVSSLEKNTFSRIDSIENNLFNRTDVLLASVNELVQESKLLSEDYRKLPQYAAKIEPYIDCENNDFCWQNLTTDVLISSRNLAVDANKSFITVNKHVPELTSEYLKVAKNLSTGIPRITDNTAQITENINRLTRPRWYDRALGYAANGTVLWWQIMRMF